MPYRKIKNIRQSSPTIEGAGVHLNRVFGFHTPEETDPFLLLDDFRSDKPALYEKGFPWHPHRGIETITYMLDGGVEHGDSLGNSGVIAAGGVQWMTAGGGIIHQEMPKGDGSGKMGGFQLWANLPAKDKMRPPRYQEFTKEQIPVVHTDNGVRVTVICGAFNGVQGPVENVVINPTYLDVSVPAGVVHIHPATDGFTILVYVISGSARFEEDKDGTVCGAGKLALFEQTGGKVFIAPGDEGARFLFISGKPLKEPIAWGGPIVMNTKAELELAFTEYQNGTFLKKR